MDRFIIFIKVFKCFFVSGVLVRRVVCTDENVIGRCSVDFNNKGYFRVRGFRVVRVVGFCREFWV